MAVVVPSYLFVTTGILGIKSEPGFLGLEGWGGLSQVDENLGFQNGFSKFSSQLTTLRLW
jgi:hypothetical protein